MDKTQLFRQIQPSGLSNKEKRRLEIIEAAIDVLADEGLNKLTFNAVGQRLGIERASVAYHFPKKEVLLAQVIRYVYLIGQQITADRSKAAKNTEAQLLSIYDSAQYWLGSDKRFPSIVTLFYYLTTTSPQFKELHSEIQKQGLNRIEQILTKHFLKKNIKTSIVKTKALSLHSLMLGMTLKKYTTHDKSSTKSKAILTKTIREMLN